MRRRSLRGGSATQARRSFHPPDSDLSREMEVMRCLQAENEDAVEADEEQRGEQEVQLQLVHRASLIRQRDQAHGSYLPHGSSLRREMEVMRCLQAENDHFEDAVEADEEQRGEHEVQAAYATSCTLRAQRYTGAPIGSPSWQLPQARDGGDALPTSRERPL